MFPAGQDPDRLRILQILLFTYDSAHMCSIFHYLPMFPDPDPDPDPDADPYPDPDTYPDPAGRVPIGLP